MSVQADLFDERKTVLGRYLGISLWAEVRGDLLLADVASAWANDLHREIARSFGI